jgi:glycosyltransferase involved in cell wall biosynthesis
VAEGDASVCLVITALALDDLARKRHGIYQRLRMLMQAATLAGHRLELICAPGTLSDQPEAEACAEVVRQVHAHWGLDISVPGMARREPDRRTPYVLQQLGSCLGRGWSESLRSAVRGGQLGLVTAALDRKPALVLAHRLVTMEVLLATGRVLPPCVFDMDDLEHVVAERNLAQATSRRERFFMRWSLPALRSLERRAVRASVRTLVCAGDDAGLLTRLAGGAPDQVAVVPNGVQRPVDWPRPLSRQPILLMVGIYSYEPNAQGAAYFMREVWPLIRAQRPDAALWFAGGGANEVPGSASPPEGVRFLGFVDDLDAVYVQASVVICPILVGGGTRIKLIEAGMRGLPIVSTTVGAEGLGMVDGRHALLCDDPVSLARACLRLWDDEPLARDMAAQVRNLMLSRFDRDVIASELALTLQQMSR